MKLNKCKAGVLLAFLVMLMLPSFSQSFYYPNSPVCNNGQTLYPFYNGGFVTGGIYSASPNLPGLNPSTGIINPNQSSPGTYIISYSASACSCINTATVIVNPVPLVSILNATMCSNEQGPVIASASPSAGLSFTWAPYYVFTPTVSIMPAGQTITLTSRNVYGCISQTTAQASVVQAGTLTVSGSSTVCKGSSISLVASGAPGYLWSTGASGNVITVSPQATTVYSVSSTATGVCTARGSKTVTVIDPQLSVNSATMCAGRGTTLSVTSSPALPYTYNWFPGPLSGQTVSVSPAGTQIYTVVVSAAGCTKTLTTQVDVSPSFTINSYISYKTPLCTKDSIAFPSLDSGTVGGGMFSVYPPNDIGFNDTTGKISFQNPGDYIVSYNLPVSGCTVAPTATVLVSIGQSGALQTGPDVIIYRGGTANLSVSGGPYYMWTPNIDLECDTCESTIATPTINTQYCVSSAACLDGRCVNVTVLCKPESDLSVPNAFTPNNDGNNDTFCLKGWNECIRSFDVMIFDRWGNKVYTSSDPSFCWDGSFNGQILNAGVYTYVITASFELVPHMVKKGNITLIR